MSKKNQKPEEGVLSNINEILQGEPHISVVLAAKFQDKDDITLVKLSLSKSAVEQLRELAKDYLVKFNFEELEEYDAGYKPSPDELCYLNLRERKQILDIVSSVTDSFDPKKNPIATKNLIDNLKFYAIVIWRKRGKRKIVFFRKANKNIELSRKFSTGLFLRGNQLSRIKQNVLLFDKVVDCFSFDGFMYVSNMHYFHQIFDYLEELKKNAKKIAKIVKEKVAIRNWKKFEEKTTSQLNMIAKLSRISEREYFQKHDKNKIMEKMKGFLDDHKEEDEILKLMDIKGTGKNLILQYDGTPKYTWAVLKLLDDDFLDSPIWDRRYEVNSKRRLKSKTSPPSPAKAKIPVGKVSKAKRGKKKKPEPVAV